MLGMWPGPIQTKPNQTKPKPATYRRNAMRRAEENADWWGTGFRTGTMTVAYAYAADAYANVNVSYKNEKLKKRYHTFRSSQPSIALPPPLSCPSDSFLLHIFPAPPPLPPRPPYLPPSLSPSTEPSTLTIVFLFFCKAGWWWRWLGCLGLVGMAGLAPS